MSADMPDADARTDWLAERADIPDDNRPHVDDLLDNEKEPEKWR